MALDADAINAIFDAVVSHPMRLGHFERVNGHEPKNAPGNGLTCAVWLDTLGPALSSGLASTSALLIFNARIYGSMLAEPQDAIDPSMTAAAAALIGAYLGDYDLGGTVRCVDVRGMAGTPLRAQAGYINQDSKIYRVMTVTVPAIVNDAWDEAP